MMASVESIIMLGDGALSEKGRFFFEVTARPYYWALFPHRFPFGGILPAPACAPTCICDSKRLEPCLGLEDLERDSLQR